MINDQLLSYVRQQLSLGIGRGVITSNLKSQGWTDTDIDEVFAVVASPTASAAVSSSSSATTSNVARTQTTQPEFSTSRATTGQSASSFQPVHKSKKIFLVVVLALLIMTGGVATYAYYTGFFVTLPNLLLKSIDNSRTVKSVDYDTTINIDFSGMKDFAGKLNYLSSVNNNTKKLNFAVRGSLDFSDPNNFKSSSILSINTDSFSLEGELRSINDILYAMLTKIPITKISAYKNKWFSFPFSAMSTVNLNIFSKLTAEQKDYIYQITKDAHIIKTIEKFSSETVSGEPSYHFAFDLDREGIISYVQSLKDYANTIDKGDPFLSTFDPASFIKGLDKINSFQGEIWIGRKNKLIHKVVMNFRVQPDLAKNEQVKINATTIFNGYNQPAFISAPVDSTSFEALVSSIISNSFGIDKTKILGNKDDLISFSISSGSKVRGIVSYRGIVKGGYFFEGNILVNVLDANKKLLKAGNAMATTEWMTLGPVGFEGNINLSGLKKGSAYFEIHNDNPSDLSKNDKSILIPIVIE